MDAFLSPEVGAFCLGVVASLVAALYISYQQFIHSTAGYRVNMVTKAHHELTSPDPKTSPLRDKYRYSLGVIINDLHQSFKGGWLENGPWPALVDNGEECPPVTKSEEKGDRWHKFNLYIRPVIEDTNAYMFLGGLRFTPALRHLRKLTMLCNQLENVVMELDAAFEQHSVCCGGDGARIWLKMGVDPNQVTSLRTAYKRLYEVWRVWCGEVNESEEFWKAHSMPDDLEVQ